MDNLISLIFRFFKVEIFFTLLLLKKIIVGHFFADLTILDSIGIFSFLSKITRVGEFCSRPPILQVNLGLSIINSINTC